MSQPSSPVARTLLAAALLALGAGCGGDETATPTSPTTPAPTPPPAVPAAPRGSVLSLVADVNARPLTNVATAERCVKASDALTYCVLHTEATGAELWRTDGTPEGTRLVKDAWPGVQGGYPEHLTVVGGALYFTATRPSVGQQLWKSDGTEAGTAPVPTPAELVRVHEVSAVGDTVYFSGTHSLYGEELWRTDGTAAGTRLVRDVNPGPATAYPNTLTPVGTRLYFTARTPAAGRELWVTDGTREGTRLVRDVLPGAEGAFEDDARSNALAAVGDTLVFVARRPETGREVYASRGTDDTTVLLTGGELQPGNGDGVSQARNVFVRLGAHLYFAGHSATLGSVLYRTDGTSEGTTVLPTGAWPLYPTASGSRLFFLSQTPEAGRELWVSDGTPAGTHLVLDASPGAPSSSARGEGFRDLMPLSGGRILALLFRADGSRVQVVTDGTPAGTSTLEGFPTGRDEGPFPLQLAAPEAGGRALFGVWKADVGAELYVSDGTQAGTRPLLAANGATASSARFLETYEQDATFLPLVPGPQGRLVFPADDGSGAGTEPWGTDGTAAGTRALGDIFPGLNSGLPFGRADTVLLGGKLLMRLRSELNTEHLWETDGTPAGTRRVFDTPFYAYGLTPFAGQAFMLSTGANGAELWRTDGTAAGTAEFKDLVPGTANGTPYGLTAGAQALYFAGNTVDAGNELWVSDGTPAGTRAFDVNPGAAASEPSSVTVVEGGVYFVATSADAGRELWRYRDGASAPERVADVRPGTEWGFPSATTPVLAPLPGGRLFFVADDGRGGGLEPWVTDGTPEGTSMLRDLYPGARSSGIRFTARVGDALYFVADDGVHGDELWVTQGTPETTRLVRDVWPGRAGGVVQQQLLHLAPASVVLFAATDGEGGVELWRTDGTVQGTQPVEDAVPGAGSLQPQRMTRVGDTVYLRGHTPAHGWELWSASAALLADYQAPALACPADVTATAAPGTRGASVSFTVPVAQGETLALSHGSGGSYPVGTTEVQATVTDAMGNSSSCTFRVTVQEAVGGEGDDVREDGGCQAGSGGPVVFGLLSLLVLVRRRR